MVTTSNIIRMCAVAVALVCALPLFASAYVITTPYWCGWGWSSTPCVTYPVQQYSYPYNYSAYSYNYTNPCVPVSWDSRGAVVQTSCGYSNVGYSHYNQYQYWSPNYYSYSQYHDYGNRHDRDWDNRRDRDRDWDHDHH